jgi:serine/threonine-protein kinase RsbT
LRTSSEAVGTGSRMPEGDVSVPIRSDADVVAARSLGRSVAESHGFGATDVTMIATAISELARNILKYAQEGEIMVEPVRRDSQAGVSVVARDAGPGIADVGLAMQDGFSTANSLGLGLPGTRRLMDEFEIVSSVGSGTVVRAIKWLR